MSSEQENNRRKLRGHRTAGKRKVKARKDRGHRYDRYQDPDRLQWPPERCPFGSRVYQGSDSPCSLPYGHDGVHEVAGLYMTDDHTITGRVLVPEGDA